MLKKLAVASALAFASMSAFAVADFTVDPSAVGSTKAPFEANLINGTSSSLLAITSPTTMVGSMWIDFTAFVKDNLNILPITSGLGADYGLFLTSFYEMELTSGTMGATGSEYDITFLAYTLYADPGYGSALTPANTSNPASATIVLDSDVIEVGVGELISGVSGWDDEDGRYFNAITSFSLTQPDGELFFTEPRPFHERLFAQLNSTGQGTVRNGSLISVNQAAGGTDFLVNRVPEPGSLALLGLGCIGLAGFGRLKSNRKDTLTV